MLVAKWDSEIEDLEFIETKGGFAEWQRLIGCEKIDIVEVTIEGVLFDVIFDRKSWFNSKNVSAIISGSDDFADNSFLLGNLIFCHHDKNGYTTGLVYGDEDLIASSVYVSNGEEELVFMVLKKSRED